SAASGISGALHRIFIERLGKARWPLTTLDGDGARHRVVRIPRKDAASMYTRSMAVAAVAAAALVTVAACDSPNKTAAPNTATTAAAAPAAGSSTPSAPAQAHNNTDVMFTQHMIPHHQQAIEMSDMILGKQGIDPRVVALANQIKAAQG